MHKETPIIEVKNLGKKYNINHQKGGYIALRDVIAGASAYAAAPDGVVPWRSRPEIFRKQSLARIPPIAVVPEAAE